MSSPPNPVSVAANRGERAPHVLRVAAGRMARLCVATLLLACAGVGRAEVKVGDAFPALANAGLVKLAGSELPALTGKVVLVDFWASWCAPCKASFPAMTRLHQELAPRGLVIVAVSVDEKPAAAAAFWKKMAPPFTGLHDREQKLVKEVVVPTMPTSYIVDRDGKVRAVHTGFHGDASEKALRQGIEELLKETNSRGGKPSGS